MSWPTAVPGGVLTSLPVDSGHENKPRQSANSGLELQTPSCPLCPSLREFGFAGAGLMMLGD